jgi:pilus assembly protein Flp/PilA
MKTIRKFLKNDKGATAIEYGLIAALIAVAAIGAMSSLGKQLGNTFNKVEGNLSNSYVFSWEDWAARQLSRRLFRVRPLRARTLGGFKPPWSGIYPPAGAATCPAKGATGPQAP